MSKSKFIRTDDIFCEDDDDDSGLSGSKDQGDLALASLTKETPTPRSQLATSTDIDEFLRDYSEIDKADIGLDSDPSTDAPSTRSSLWKSFTVEDDHLDDDDAPLDLSFTAGAEEIEQELNGFFSATDSLSSLRETNKKSGLLFFQEGDGDELDSVQRPSRRGLTHNFLSEADLFGDESSADDDDVPFFLNPNAKSFAVSTTRESQEMAHSVDLKPVRSELNLALPRMHTLDIESSVDSGADEDDNEEEEEEEEHEQQQEEQGPASGSSTETAPTNVKPDSSQDILLEALRGIDHVTLIENSTSPIKKSEKKALESALKKYQSTLETAVNKNAKMFVVFEQRVRELNKQLHCDMDKFSSWGDRTLKLRYRKFALLEKTILNCQEGIYLEKSASLGGRISDIRVLLDALQKGIKFTVAKAFYKQPSDMFHSRSIVEAETWLRNLYKEKDKRVESLSVIVKKVMKVNAKERITKLKSLVESVECDEQRANYSEPNWVIQRDFDGWVQDVRTPEGKQMKHACTAIAESLMPGATPLDPQEIVLLLDDFSSQLSSMLKKGKHDVPHSKEKLLLLLERSLFSMAYQNLEKLSPEYPNFRELNLKWLEHIQKLRESKTLEKSKTDSSLSLNECLLQEPCLILSDLPFQTTPTDMINIVERTISRLSVLGSMQFNRALSADDVIPLLMDVIVRTDLPGLHECIYFMTSLSQDQFRNSSVFGWSLVAFQSAIEQLKQTPE